MNMRLICEKQIEHNKKLRTCIAASSTTVKLLTVSTLKSCVIFWHSKISSGVLERLLPKSDSRSRDSSWPNRTPLSSNGRPSRLPTFTNAV